jgi:hypothetical protein
MFYRIEPTLDEKVTGIDDVQASSAIYPVNIWDPIYINQWGNTLIPDFVVLPIPKIKAKANLTDLMSVFFTGSGGRLTISNRLKEILEKNSHGNIQFIPITIYYKKKYLSDYWLTNILSFDNAEVVNYNMSLVYLQYSGEKEHTYQEIKSYNEHLIARKKNAEAKPNIPAFTLIEKLYFKDSIRNNLCTVEYINIFPMSEYFVSENLKREIESAGCTGIEFLPIEQI